MFLLCHASTPDSSVRSIETSVQRHADGRLVFSYRLLGDTTRLRIPPNNGRIRADGLWLHTCFEAFVAEVGSDRYMEFNFSPSGEWAGYAFSSYRQRNAAADPPNAPTVTVHHSTDGFSLEAHVDCPPGDSADRTLLLGLTAVIEDNDGQRSYWALSHGDGAPPHQPDFHRRDSFVLQITAPNHFS